MEVVGIDSGVMAQFVKLASLSLCPNLVGQAMVRRARDAAGGRSCWPPTHVAHMYMVVRAHGARLT